MPFDWDDDTVLALIEKFHKHEHLWNPRDPDYKNRSIRSDALKMLATSFTTDATEIERKLKNLTSHYLREKKKLEETRKLTNKDDTREPKWFAYKALDFLRDKKKPDTLSSVNASLSESQQKKQIRKKSEVDSTEAVQLLRVKDASASQLTSTRDEASVFGEYIAGKIRKMDPITTSRVQHQIQNIIYQAEMGIYAQITSVVASSTSPVYFADNSDTQDSLYTFVEDTDTVQVKSEPNSNL